MLSSNAIGGRVFNNVIEYNDIKVNEKKKYCGSYIFHLEHGHWGNPVRSIFRCGECERCLEEKSHAVVN